MVHSPNRHPNRNPSRVAFLESNLTLGLRVGLDPLYTRTHRVQVRMNAWLL